MPVLYKEYITRKFIQKHPDWYFIFGDNIQRKGFGGQAKEMRGEPNSIGVVTKATPSTDKNAYLSDSNEEHFETMMKDLYSVYLLLQSGNIVVLPSNGLGTGLAKLNEKAPKLFLVLSCILYAFEKEFGVVKQ